MPDTYNINDWINPSLDNPPEDAITDQPLNTYNGSEYVINGVTYRNLEAQVKHNQDSDKDLSDRIDATNARIADVEDQLPFCVKFDAGGVCDKTMGEIIEAKSNGAYIYLSTSNVSNPAYFTVLEIRTNGTKHYFNAYSIYGDATDPYIVFLFSDECDDDEYPTLTYDESYQGSAIYWCEHGVTTDQDIEDALDAGQLPALLYNGNVYIYYWTTSGYRYFMSFVNNTISRIMMTQSSSYWGTPTNLALEQTSNRVTTIDSTSTDSKYPTAKAVYDFASAIKGIYWCTYGVTTAQQVLDAISSGLLPMTYDSGNNLCTYCADDGTYLRFTTLNRNALKAAYCNKQTNAWTQGYNQAALITTDRVTSIDSTSTDTQVPSAKLLYDQLLLKQPLLFYQCTYSTTTFADITTAVDAGLIPIVRYNNVQYYYSHKATASGVTYHYFTCDYYTTLRYVRCRETTNAWSSSSTTAQTTSNKKSTPQTSASYYPDFSYINTYERMLIVTYNHGTNATSHTFAEITTADANGRKIQMVDNLGTVYQLARMSASEIIFSACYMGAADADITCENVSISSSNVITYYSNQGG